ncbi:hypothetical protein [Nocardia paucivorans]|uniref:hypothetical protein n=1 Tax=Nocardia paucivorans TaxID=114259 RepID=UPI00030C1F6E|nr:hypothetical protein [Nocardia paucivorans]
MTGPEAARLREQQAALVRALVRGDPVPPGFDRAAVAAAAEVLLRKRAREIAAHHPTLAHAAGPDFLDRFVEWARHRPKTGVTADAIRFARDTAIPWSPHEPSRWGRLSALLRAFRRG